MIRTFIIITTLLLVIGPVLADSASSSQERLNVDEQIALDLEHLNIGQLLDASTGNVAIVSISPSPAAGDLVTNNKYKDVTDAKTGAKSRSIYQVTFEGWEVGGHYTSYNPFNGKSNITDSSYHWTAPYVMDRGAYLLNENRLLPWSEHDNRFILGGILICHVNNALSGSSRFSEDSLIPASWQRYVAGALAFSKEHPGFFSPDNAKKNTLDLVSLASSPNPFLSIEATRSLTQAGLLDTSFIQSNLAKADFYKQAVFTLLLLRDATPQTRPETIKGLSDLISSAANAEAIKGIALAAYAANDNGLLAQVDKKMAALNSDTPANKYIVNLLKIAGTRK